MSNSNPALIETREIPEDRAEGVSPSSQSSAEKVAALISIPAIIGSAFTAGAYLTGVAFHQAYLTAFKVNYGLFPKPTADYFLFAYYALLELLPTWLSVAGNDVRVILLVFFALLFIYAMPKVGAMLDKSAWLKQFQTSARKRKILGVVGELLLVPTIGLALLFYIPILIMFLLIIPVLVGQTSGTKMAKTEMSRIEHGCKPVQRSRDFCTRILDDGNVIAEGFVIEVSNQYVAIVEGKNARVLPIKERAFVALVD